MAILTELDSRTIALAQRLSCFPEASRHSPKPAALSEVVAMESKEGCLGWGLRGVEWVPVGRSYFRDGCARGFLLFGKVVTMVGTNGETDTRRDAKRGP
jgi:hypothetical protein